MTTPTEEDERFSFSSVEMDEGDFVDENAGLSSLPPVLTPNINHIPHTDNTNTHSDDLGAKTQLVNKASTTNITQKQVQNAIIMANTNNTSRSQSDGQSAFTSNDAQGDSLSRVRQYSDQCAGPYVVMIREKEYKLAPVKSASYISSTYMSLKEIKHNHDSLKVIFTDLNDANALVLDAMFKRFFVSIPADFVEIVGAVNFSDLHDIEDVSDLCKHGYGRFSNNLVTECKILDAQRLTRLAENKSDYEFTNAVKVTFEGRLLPKFIVYNNLIIHVRLFYQKPMFCEKCQMFGHTNRFCRRKPKCARCAEAHLTSECKQKIPNPSICTYCSTAHEGGREKCAYFKEVADSMNNNLKQRYKSRYTRAIAVAQSQSSQNPSQRDEVHFPPLHNEYAILSVEDPQPSCSQNIVQPSNSRSFPPPPTNIYAKRQSTSKNTSSNGLKRNWDRSVVSNKSTQPVQMPHAPQKSSSVPVWPNPPTIQSYPTTTRSNGDTEQSSPLRNILITLARNAGLSATWMAIIEAIIDPLLEALLPLSSTIIAALAPIVLKSSHL